MNVKEVSYHVNPDTGKAGICSAKYQCQFKISPGEHYPSIFMAQTAYEAVHKHEEVPQRLSKKSGNFTKVISRKMENIDEPVSGTLSEVIDGENVYTRIENIDQLPRITNKYELTKMLGDDSPASCPECGRRFKKFHELRLISNYSITCSQCGENMNICSVNVDTRADFVEIEEDTNNIKNRRWVHATRQGPTWFEDVTKAGIPVHVGPPEAAVERILTNIEYSEKKDIYFYQLEFDPECQVDEEIQQDFNGSFFEKDLDKSEKDAYVYSNVWEGMGTFSIETKPSSLRVRGMRKVHVDDLTDIRSLYNIPNEKVYNDMPLADLEKFFEENSKVKEL